MGRSELKMSMSGLNMSGSGSGRKYMGLDGSGWE